jgi:predicted transcriptional regulator
MTEEKKLTRRERSAKNKAEHKAKVEKAKAIGMDITDNHFRDEVETRSVGRPEVITPEMKEEILELIASNYFVMEIAEKLKISRRTILRHVRKDPDFQREWNVAREASAEFMVERMIMIALGRDPWVEGMPVDERRLVLDTIKWIAGKILWRVYGDKQNQVNVTGLPGAVVNVGSQIIDVELPEDVEAALLEALDNVEYEVLGENN